MGFYLHSEADLLINLEENSWQVDLLNPLSFFSSPNTLIWNAGVYVRKWEKTRKRRRNVPFPVIYLRKNFIHHPTLWISDQWSTLPGRESWSMRLSWHLCLKCKYAYNEYNSIMQLHRIHFDSESTWSVWGIFGYSPERDNLCPWRKKNYPLVSN